MDPGEEIPRLYHARACIAITLPVTTITHSIASPHCPPSATIPDLPHTPQSIQVSPTMAQINGEAPPVAQEKINTDIVTLTRFLTEEQTKHKEATGDFTYVVIICITSAHQ